MMLRLVPVCLLAAVALGAAPRHAPTTTPAPDAERLKKLEEVTEQLARQLMLQQMYVEEKTRSEGDSGVKQMRMRRDGVKSYHVDSFAGHSVSGMHDHSNLINTVGMGEMVAVLNGLEFRTRHNDYKLRMPVHNNKTFDALEDIPFPPVPQSVLRQPTMEKQAAELREYFKAWKDQDVHHRDYRQYFKPVLCFLEGAWTLDKSFSEPFASDRHAIEASSWMDLQDKIRFTSYTGDRLNTQNYAYLPTTIYNVTDGVPQFAQWNYRIICHPLKAAVNVSKLIPMEDVQHRMAERMGFDDRFLHSRVPRFRMEQPRPGTPFFQWNQLDDWMQEVPGKDNYGAKIEDDAFGLAKMDMELKNKINVAHYHRRWKVGARDAMGDTIGHRGYSDRSLFVAETTQPRIAPASLKHVCTRPQGRLVCQDLEKRVSYAVPLELIFLTPLQSWNPYNIEYKGSTHDPRSKAVTADGRNGGTTADKAYNGTYQRSFYYTPVEFFTGSEMSHDPADTTRAATGVLDRHGNVRLLKSSGIRINLPNIPGVGSLRTRYPIMPLWVEGTAQWKEIEALTDIVMDLDKNKRYMAKPPEGLNTYHALPSHHDPIVH